MFVISVLKLLIFLLRRLTSNSATALPGLVLEKYFPSRLRRFLSQFDHVILITGTNGKTTTSRMLGQLLEQNNIAFISNKSGSNLIRGILSELVDRANYFGQIKEKVAVFEVEEATMPRLVKFVKPEIIVVTNIFRDQLDAYGEIDKTLQYIREAIRNADNPKLVLNKDDQRVGGLEEFTDNEVAFISFDKKYLGMVKWENKNLFQKEREYRKNSVLYKIRNIRVNDDLASCFDLENNEKKILQNYSLLVPGYHNTFNAVAALLSFTLLLGTRLQHISDIEPGSDKTYSSVRIDQEKGLLKNKNLNISLNEFNPVFGRGEIVRYKDTGFQILLGKNPAGLNLNFQLLQNVKKREALLLILNDKIADGKDVSWIWDCDFRILKRLNFENIFITGTRRYDMALRVKYENIKICDCKNEDKCNCEETHILNSIPESIEVLADKGYEKVFVLTTYTAMLEFRKEMGKRAKVVSMYE